MSRLVRSGGAILNPAMTSVLRRAALILLCSAIAACAAEGDGGGFRGGGREHGEGGPPRRPLPNVFISLSGEPFRAEPGAPYPVVDWFARADSDHDGRLSKAEAQADALRFFDQLDENHDGVLDGLEVQDYEQKVAPEILPQIAGLHAGEGMDQSLTFGDPNNTDNRPRGTRGGGLNARQPTPPQGIGVQGAAVYSLENTPEPVAAADAELNGRITRAEFAKAVDRRFDGLDKTGLGYLMLKALPRTPIQSEILRRKTQAEKARSGRGGRRPHDRPSADAIPSDTPAPDAPSSGG
jgi:hypothetical protein